MQTSALGIVPRDSCHVVALIGGHRGVPPLKPPLANLLRACLGLLTREEFGFVSALL